MDFDGLPLAGGRFVLTKDVAALGRTGELAAHVRRSELARVRRGVYEVPTTRDPRESPAAWKARRYRGIVVASSHTLRAPIYTSYSAVSLLGLPIVGEWPDEVVVLAPGRSGHRRPGVRAVARTRDVEMTDVGGLLVTSVEYSLIQLARDAPLITALTAMDAALRSLPYGLGPAPLTTLDQLWATHRELKPYPRSRRVESVLSRARSLAGSPLETCSRLVIEEFGFPEPELQWRVELPDGEGVAWLDFGWPEYGVGAEADGNGKYLDGGTAQAAAARVIEEKRREDAVRRVLHGFARWDWPEMQARLAIGRRLVRAGLPMLRKPIRLF